MANKHSGPEIISKCPICAKVFFNTFHLKRHIFECHPPSKELKEKENAFNKKFITYQYTYPDGVDTLEKSQNDEVLKQVLKTLKYEAASKHFMRVSLILIANMVMLNADGEIEAEGNIPFRATSFMTNEKSMHAIRRQIRTAFREQETRIEEFSLNGSNWVFNYAVCMEVEIGGAASLSGGAYDGHVTELKREGCRIKSMKGYKHITDIVSKNPNDNMCFLYCVMAFLWGNFLPKCDRDKAEKYRNCLKKIKFQNFSLPMKVNEIEKFCKENEQLDLKFNVLFRSSEGDIYPLRTNIGNGTRRINILLLDLDDTFHYVLINDLNKFLRKVYGYEDTTVKNTYKKQYFCLNCLNHFATKEKLANHKELCTNHATRREEVPSCEDSALIFEKFEHSCKQDLVGYLDFECIVPQTKGKNPTCSRCTSLRCKCDTSYTHEISSHEPCAYHFVIVNKSKQIVFEHTYAGKNAGDNFIEMLLQQEKEWIAPLFKTTKPMKELTKNQKESFENATHCYICKNPLGSSKCHDHDHLTGKFDLNIILQYIDFLFFLGNYIGAAHQGCNLKRQRPRKLNIYLHNGSKYDMHLILNALKKNVYNLKVLPFNNEHYRTLSFNRFVIADSMHFLNSSLASLASDLYKSNHNYKVI